MWSFCTYIHNFRILVNLALLPIANTILKIIIERPIIWKKEKMLKQVKTSGKKRLHEGTQARLHDWTTEQWELGAENWVLRSRNWTLSAEKREDWELRIVNLICLGSHFLIFSFSRILVFPCSRFPLFSFSRLLIPLLYRYLMPSYFRAIVPWCYRSFPVS